MSDIVKFPTIKGWAILEKDQPLIPFSYQPAALLSNDIEIEITHCGICGTDLHTLNSGWRPTLYPCIVGHEIVGHVTAFGSNVSEFQIGDRVGVGAQCAACMKDDCYACSVHREAHCPFRTSTYNAIRSIDGSKTYGGYAEAIRVQKDFVFKIPEGIPSEAAAPLLCAGATVFKPMMQYGFKKEDKVGVIGIGGLGHLGIMFTSAFGCDVSAISHSKSKKDDALSMGARRFIDITDQEQCKIINNQLDYLLITNNSDVLDWTLLSRFMKLDATLIMLAMPESEIKISSFALQSKNLRLAGSKIASPTEIIEMLKFAEKYKIFPWTETIPMEQCNDGVKRVKEGKARYRVVLHN